VSAASVGTRLPLVKLPGAGGKPVPLRGVQGPATLVARGHGPACRGCRAWLREHDEGLADAVRMWGGRAVAVTPDGGGEEGPPPLVEGGRVVRTVSDPEDRVPSVPSGGAGMLVADRYGEVFEVEDAGEGHGLPGPRELEEWLRFLATQCPE